MELMKKWKKVGEIIENARREVIEEVQKIADFIVEKYGKEIDEIAKELNVACKMKVYEGDGDLNTITPVLYLKADRVLSEEEKEKIIEEFRRRMKEWGEHGRIRVEFVPDLISLEEV